MKEKQLLIESCIVDAALFKEVPKSLTESVVDGKAVGILRTISGPMSIINTPTGNGRTYPENEMAMAIKNLQPKLEARTVLGNADHPKETPSLKEVSHLQTQLWIESYNGVKYLFGTWEILDTPNGRILNTLWESKIGIGSSLRGYGNVDESTGVVSSYDLVVVDAVVDPSASTYLSEKNFKSEPVQENLSEKVKTIQESIENLKKVITEQNEKKEKEQKEKNELEEQMKIKANKDVKIGETTVKAGEPIETDDPSKLGLADGEYTTVAESQEFDRKMKVAGAKIKDLTEKINALREYTLKAEKVGDIIAEELRKTVSSNDYNTKAVEQLKKYALTLESTIDGNIRDFMKNSVESLEEMTQYALTLEKTVDEELVPYAHKLEKTIDEELVPYAQKLESVIAEMTEQVKSGKIYENVNADHVGLVEKAIATYPVLSSLKEELLQTRDEEHLEERLHKYLVMFANRGQNKELKSSYVHEVKLARDPKTDKEDGITGRLDSLYETKFD